MKLLSNDVYHLKNLDHASNRPLFRALFGRRSERRLRTPGNPLSERQSSSQTDAWRCKVLQLAKKMPTEQRSMLQMQVAMLSDEDGDRPIHVAVANENLKLVYQLCLLMTNASISIDLTNHMRQTALHLAVILGNIHIVKLLLKFRASPVLCDRNGNSVLHLAVKAAASKEILETLLSHPEAACIKNIMDHEGYSAFHHAVLKNNLDAVSLLHQHGVNVNKIDGKSGRTALIHAILEQNSEMIQLLLRCGACPQKADYSGRSAHDLALQIGNTQNIEILDKQRSSKESFAIEGERLGRTNLKTAVN